MTNNHYYKAAANIIFTLSILFCTGCANNADIHFQYQPKTGDFIFQSLPHMDLVDAIEGTTNSPYSHVGLVINKDNRWYVREAIGPVQDTLLAKWVSRGRQQNIAVYRLKPQYQHLIGNIIIATQHYLGKPYDVRYRFDDAYIYCSELLYKAYYDATGKTLGKLNNLGELNWQPYTNTIKKYEQGPVPMQRAIITPVHLSQARQLEEVYSSY